MEERQLQLLEIIRAHWTTSATLYAAQIAAWTFARQELGFQSTREQKMKLAKEMLRRQINEWAAYSRANFDGVIDSAKNCGMKVPENVVKAEFDITMSVFFGPVAEIAFDRFEDNIKSFEQMAEHVKNPPVEEGEEWKKDQATESDEEWKNG